MLQFKLIIALVVLAVVVWPQSDAKPAVVWTVITPAPTPTSPTNPPSAVCHPQPTAGADQFMIGYGSLMQNASKSRTAPNTGDSMPVRIRGFSRQWNAQGVSISFSTTFLGIIQNSSASFNGVIFQLPDNGNMARDLQSYDDREEWYCRQLVPSADIDSLVTSYTINRNAQYWIYVNKPQFTAPPNPKYPIVESYVDIFMSGCLELEVKYNITDFAKSCVTSTVGWDAPWVNDRLYPRRAFIYEPKASKIDVALAAGVPSAYNSIQIEG